MGKSAGARVLVTLLIAFAVEALTSYGQTFLPHAVAPLANGSTPWCAVAFALASVVPRSQRALSSLSWSASWRRCASWPGTTR